MPGRNLDYEVSVVGPEFGRLLRLCSDGEAVPFFGGEERCFAILHGRPSPCDDCPLLRSKDGPWPSVNVRHRPTEGSRATEAHIEITTASPIDAATVRVCVQSLSEATLRAIHDTKIERLAEKANLSDREREVMRHLLTGLAIEDIATVLNITPRTVKYHQSNLLQKLGADSRVDLLRLVF
jgi:DNA-binding CsgD family transcriptional regulator